VYKIMPDGLLGLHARPLLTTARGSGDFQIGAIGFVVWLRGVMVKYCRCYFVTVQLVRIVPRQTLVDVPARRWSMYAVEIFRSPPGSRRYRHDAGQNLTLLLPCFKEQRPTSIFGAAQACTCLNATLSLIPASSG